MMYVCLQGSVVAFHFHMPGLHVPYLCKDGLGLIKVFLSACMMRPRLVRALMLAANALLLDKRRTGCWDVAGVIRHRRRGRPDLLSLLRPDLLLSGWFPPSS